MNCHSLFPRDPLKGALHHELFNMGTSHSPTLLSETIKQYHGILMDPGLNDGLWAQRKIPSCLREELAVECGNQFFSLSRPLDLPVALQTEEWNNLILSCKRFKNLEISQRTALVRLLTALGFQRYTIEELIEGVNREAIKPNCSESCDYANALARARFLTYKEQGQGYLSSYTPEDYWEIINSRVEIKHKISPAFSLMLQYITEVPDPQRVGYLSDLIIEALESVDDVFNKSFFASIYHRGFAMLPAKKGDSEGIAYHMSRAEDLAHWCLGNPRSSYQKFIARENLYSVYESSIKAALQMEEKANKYRELGARLFELDPFDSRALMSAAESYVASGDLKLGADLYFRAACCGSLYTAIAWYMAGQCYALLKRRELAAWCFLKSYENDNDAAAPVEDLLELKFAGTSFDAWARMTK